MIVLDKVARGVGFVQRLQMMPELQNTESVCIFQLHVVCELRDLNSAALHVLMPLSLTLVSHSVSLSSLVMKSCANRVLVRLTEGLEIVCDVDDN